MIAALPPVARLRFRGGSRVHAVIMTADGRTVTRCGHAAQPGDRVVPATAPVTCETCAKKTA